MADIECPSCGGSGGGPFGRAGSAWDTETYVCPRCEGSGQIDLQKPGVVKTAVVTAPVREKKQA